MSNTTPSNQPFTLATLADAFGCNRDHTALLASAIAAGVAGAHAGLRSGLGTTYPGFSLVCATADPAVNRLLDNLLEPANHFQRHLRTHCRSLSPARLDIRTTPQRLGVRTEPSLAEKELDPFVDTPVPFQRLQAALHPTVMINAPDAKIYERGLKECADRSPLVVTGFPAAALAATIARDSMGADRIFESAQGSVETVRTRMLLRCDPGQLRAEFRAGNLLLEQALIAAPAIADKRSIPLDQRRQASQRYTGAIKECINARYCGNGVIFSVKDEAAEFMDDAAGKIEATVRRLAPEVQPYLRDAACLPMRLLWAYTLFAYPSEIPQIHIAAAETANSIIDKSTKLLESLARAGYDDEELVMLGKLSKEPLPFRGLIRRYSRQQRSIHEPVLGRLVSKGFVNETGDLLHLTDPGREFLTRVTSR